MLVVQQNGGQTRRKKRERRKQKEENRKRKGCECISYLFLSLFQTRSRTPLHYVRQEDPTPWESSLTPGPSPSRHQLLDRQSRFSPPYCQTTPLIPLINAWCQQENPQFRGNFGEHSFQHRERENRLFILK